MKKSFLLATIITLISLSCGDKPSAPGKLRPLSYQKELNPWPVSANGQEFSFPYLGGFNNPKPSLVDFDGDGLLDLMVGQGDGTLGYFRNLGSSYSPHWIPEQGRLGNLDVGTWHTFGDIDGDGDLDLFCDSRESSVLFYRNVSSGSAIRFAPVEPNYGDFSTGVNSTPTFADIDNDNDLDFFYGAVSGRLEFHRNDGNATNAKFSFVTDSYDDILAYPLGPINSTSEMHGYSVIRFADIDNDQDLDLFWGDIYNPNLYFFSNAGTPAESHLLLVGQDYLPGATAGFNHPALGDIDNDGDIDMILGLGLDAPTNGLRLYRNNGTPTDAAFTYETSDIISQIDIGTGSVPTFGDLDNDGDYDMILGGSSGRLAYFENTGSASSPSFELISRYFQNIDVGYFSAPILVDWNGDGRLDLLIGNLNGYVEYWRHDSTVESYGFTQVTSRLGDIKVDQLASPQAADMNGDGLLDLIVGEWDFNQAANLHLYHNTGSVENPTLQLVTTTLLRYEQQDFALPVVVDWNDDSLPDIILGGAGPELTLWQNSSAADQLPDSTSLLRRPDVLPGSRDGHRLCLRFVDIDADGDLDIFVGEEGGGLNFYRHH